VPEHQPPGELVVGRGLLRVVLDERHRGVDRGHVGARVRGHDAHQAEVVDVLVGQDHEPELL
jgi:hypothetical protein